MNVPSNMVVLTHLVMPLAQDTSGDKRTLLSGPSLLLALTSNTAPFGHTLAAIFLDHPMAHYLTLGCPYLADLSHLVLLRGLPPFTFRLNVGLDPSGPRGLKASYSLPESVPRRCLSPSTCRLPCRTGVLAMYHTCPGSPEALHRQ